MRENLSYVILIAIIILCLVASVGTIIGLIICFTSYRGENPVNWTLEFDRDALSFQHSNCCYVENIYCSRRGCHLTLKYPLVRSVVFPNLTESTQPEHAIIYTTSSAFNCSGYLSQYASKSSYLTLESITKSDGFDYLRGTMIDCFTDFNETLVSSFRPDSIVNDYLYSTGTGLAVTSGLLLFIVVGLTVLGIVIHWCYR